MPVNVAADRSDEATPQVTGLSARHHGGQTFLTWHEVDPPPLPDSPSVPKLRRLRRRLESGHKVRYLVYASRSPIHRVDGLKPIAEVGPLSCWNVDFYGIYPKSEHRAMRYVIACDGKPLPPGAGLFVHNPPAAGRTYYAVTCTVDGKENRRITGANSLSKPVVEQVGRGVPVLQRVIRPERFHYIPDATLYHYTRWESPPCCSVVGRPFDYLVAIPKKLAKPAPVGIHLHCWGGSVMSGYGWWYNAEKGSILLATNQIPYDWWTGYHERLLTRRPPRKDGDWRSGVVRPFTQRRIFAMLDWLATRWDIDLGRTFSAGSSMGGSGSLMLAIRHPDRIAWAVSWVGVHRPRHSPTFRNSYADVYGEPELQVRYEDGTPVWDYFDDVWYLKHHRRTGVGLLIFSNGKNDGGIGWSQAVDFYRTLQETRQPHVFYWGQAGHGQRTRMPDTGSERVLGMDLRCDLTLPAFTRCSLDDDPGNGDPNDGDPHGQVNGFLYWRTDDIVDENARWAMTLKLSQRADADDCTADVTPRRCRRFRPSPGQSIRWVNRSSATGRTVQQGRATVDKYGLVTVPQVRVSKAGNRLILEIDD